MVRLAAFFVMLALLTAGCMGSSSTNGEDGEAPKTAERSGSAFGASGAGGEGKQETMVSMKKATGHINADARYLGVDPATAGASVTQEVPRNATGLLAEIKFSGIVSDFDLVVFSPKFCPAGGFPAGTAQSMGCFLQHWATKSSTPGAYRASRGGASVSAATLRLEVPASAILADCADEKCPWRAVAWWNHCVSCDYDLRLSVFTGGPPIKDYTAFQPT